MSVVDVAIASTAHDVADARLQRLAAALTARGLRVGLHGVLEAATPPHLPGVTVHTFPRSGLLRRGLRSLFLPLAAGRHARVLVTVDPELTVTGLLWRSVTRARLVADVHEDYQALLRDRAWARGIAGRLAVRLATTATTAAMHADLTTVADEHVPPLRARRRLVVRNIPLAEDVPAAAPPGATPRALYVGDVRTSRGLRWMVEAVIASPPWELDIVGRVADADAGWLRTRLSGASLDAVRVRVHGRLPVEQAWQLAAGAWTGLALLDNTPAFRDALPTKLYEYLAAGLPVLATPLPRMQEFLLQTGTGLLVTSAEQTAITLRRCWREPSTLEPYRAAARKWSAEHLRNADPYGEFARAVAALLI